MISFDYLPNKTRNLFQRIADHLYPEENITKDKIADFFKNELRKLCKK